MPPTAGHRILVVDDNADAAESLAMLLRLMGHDMRIALTGAAALTEAEAFRPEVVFLDIGLPEMDGYEVARQLRARPEMQQALLIALTGFDQDEVRDQATAAGFDRHVVKPLEVETIEDLLAQVGSIPRAS
jgi:CheY-like chemotaxis protein